MYFRSVILQGFTGLGHLFAVLVYYKYHQRPHACSISTEDDPIPKQPTTTHNLFGYNTTTAHKVVSRNSSPDDEVISVLVTSLSVTLSVTTHRVLRLTKRPPLIPLAAHLLLDLSLSSQRLLVHRVYVGSHTTAPDYLWPCTFLFDVPVKSKVTHLSKGLLPTSIRT